MESGSEFFLFLVDNGENIGGLLKNSKKVKKEAASKGLRSNG